MIVRLNLNNGSVSANHPRQKALRWTERVLLLAGALALGYYGYVHADTWIYQDYQGWALDRNLAGKEATATGYLEHVIDSKSEADPENVAVVPHSPGEAPVVASVPRGDKNGLPAAPKKQDQSLVGRIEIPRVKVSAVVREGVDDKTLRRAVGHVPGTAIPGKPGNVALAGHRDTFFIGLRNIRKTDRIQLRTLEGEFEYEVDSIRIVTPKDVEVIAPTKDPALTLVTCYPFNYVGSAPKRYIVRAKQVRPVPGDVVEAKAGGSAELAAVEGERGVTAATATAVVRGTSSSSPERSRLRRAAVLAGKARS